MERKHICKEESKRLDFGGEGEERISGDLRLLNLNGRELGRVPGLESKDDELHWKRVGFSEVEGHPGEEASR